MKLVIVITSILFLASCKPRSTVNDDDIYSFVNQIIAQRAPVNFEAVSCLVDKKLDSSHYTQHDSIALVKKDSIFSSQDVTFMCQQMRSSDDFILKPLQVKRKKVISLDTLRTFGKLTDQAFWDTLKQRYGVDDFATISKPFFSIDKSKIIVTCNYYTRFGGNGETDVFNKENGKWKLTKMVGFWDN
jgi:hypothetical protein